MAYFDVDKRRQGIISEGNLSGSMATTAPGPDNLPSYAIPGFPFATGSTSFSNTKVSFPGVTNWIQVISNSGAVSFSFVDGVAAANACRLPATGNSTGIMHLRTSCMWITGDATVVAGLTGISSGSLNFDAAAYHS